MDLTLQSQHVGEDTWQLGCYLPIEATSFLAVNSYFIAAQQPIVIDTGIALLGQAYLEQLQALCPLSEIKWIFLSHMDPDHIGNLVSLLQAAPQARVISNFLGAGKLSLMGIDASKIEMKEAGEHVHLGDRQLQVLQMPSYDAPETLGVFDNKTQILFSSDCMGALVSEPVTSADELPQSQLLEGIRAWSAIDCPWLANIDADKLFERHADFFALKAKKILSSHLAPYTGNQREIFVKLLQRVELAA